jgi:hypothetical protein
MGKEALFDEAKLLEELAALEHQQWCEWAQHLMKHEKLSPERCDRWYGLMGDYITLPEHVKEQDRDWARLALAIVKCHLQRAKDEHS